MQNFWASILRIALVAVGIGGMSSVAHAQCSGQFPANTFCGNNTGALALPGPKVLTPGSLQPIAGGTVIGNPTGATAVPTATAAPVLGIPGSVQGSVSFAGTTSGTAVLRGQAAAGTPTLLLPTTSGTLPSTASAPLALNATTGALSITGLAGGVLAGSAPAFTTTPVLGASGTLGSIGFGNVTSGIVTLQTVTGALGTPTILLPSASGTVAVSASSPLVLGAVSGALTCPTCVTSSGGGAITGTAPINVSAAGVVSLTTPLALNFGGTAASLTAANGGVVYSTASALAILAPTATARQMLQSGASAAPSWSTSVWPTTTTINQILYSSAANTVTGIATVNGGILNASATGVPSVTVTPTIGLAGTSTGTITLAGATSGGVTIQPQSAAGTYNFNLPVTAGSSGAPLLSGGGAGAPMTFGILGLSFGGTNAALTASNGGLVYSTASALAILNGTATANQIPLSGSNAAPSWSTAVYPATTAAGTVLASATANTIAATATPTLGVNGGTGGQITLNGATSGSAVVSVAAAAGTTTFRLPVGNGSNGQVLSTDGAGNLSYISAGGTGTVTSVAPGAGLTTTIIASPPGSAITTLGTISSAQTVNAQTGTSYAIADADRAVLLTASNAAAQAYTIAQAGASSAFQSGWWVDVSNKSTTVAGVVTITPTTSTINGAATLVLRQGQSVRIVSDGTNYQTASLTGVRRVTRQVFSSSGTYTPTVGMITADIECVGGGGGGGGVAGATTFYLGSGGGGAGGFSRSIVTAATVGASQVVTIGTGGSGGAAGLNNGGAGGASSVGSLCTANGGGGGTAVSSGQATAVGGPGGAAGTGGIPLGGSGGSPGIYFSGGTAAVGGGNGGSSFYGGAGVGGTGAGGAATGGGALGYGSGGGGAAANNIASNAAGGNALGGAAIITEFVVQ